MTLLERINRYKANQTQLTMTCRELLMAYFKTGWVILEPLVVTFCLFLKRDILEIVWLNLTHAASLTTRSHAVYIPVFCYITIRVKTFVILFLEGYIREPLVVNFCPFVKWDGLELVLLNPRISLHAVPRCSTPFYAVCSTTALGEVVRDRSIYRWYVRDRPVSLLHNQPCELPSCGQWCGRIGMTSYQILPDGQGKKIIQLRVLSKVVRHNLKFVCRWLLTL